MLMGGAGYMAGQALATTWRPVWQVIAYSLLLGAVDRFLVFALFNGSLLSVVGYVLDTAVIAAISLCGYRLARVRRMIGQYPWLYERNGVFFWRKKGDSGSV
jgi:type IV secretory pathway TrbD component